jgi:hypothetical protein
MYLVSYWLVMYLYVYNIVIASESLASVNCLVSLVVYIICYLFIIHLII